MPYFEPIPPHVERAAQGTIGADRSAPRPGSWIELQLRGMKFERERPVLVHYRGVEIPGQRIDLIVDACLVVELKAASRFEAAHHGQVISYLRTTGLRLGLLLNFSCPTLKDGIRRIIL